MQFTPKTDKEIAEEGLLPEGVYDFTVSGAIDKTSKAGNEMIEMTVRVYKPDGNFILVTDYLMEKIAYKLKHACDACGLGVAYSTGTLNSEDFIGKSGKCKVKIQKDKEGQYPDKNVIADYVVDKLQSLVLPNKPLTAKSADPQSPVIDDEIPWG